MTGKPPKQDSSITVRNTKPCVSPGGETSDGNLLVNIREMMEEMHSDIISKFDMVVSQSVKREITAVLEPFERKLRSVGDTVSELERAANDHSDKLTELEAKVSTLTTLADSLTKKCDDLEGRSRWNNIRLLGLPEGSEGKQPTDFMAQLLHDLLGLQDKTSFVCLKLEGDCVY
ncbi:hypothetical protein L3Q82_017143 [Scomber scombrus]|uniref:Uncharacterized protein n=1 Tax=Scomber scombrus TaxID=13677 RepID=A0AAV1QHF4_SCOSC